MLHAHRHREDAHLRAQAEHIHTLALIRHIYVYIVGPAVLCPLPCATRTPLHARTHTHIYIRRRRHRHRHRRGQAHTGGQGGREGLQASKQSKHTVASKAGEERCLAWHCMFFAGCLSSRPTPLPLQALPSFSISLLPPSPCLHQFRRICDPFLPPSPPCTRAGVCTQGDISASLRPPLPSSFLPPFFPCS